MGKVYSHGIASPKGFDLVAAEPVDQRTIVDVKTDLYYLPKVYPGLKVQVLESIDGLTLREYKFMGGDSSLPSSWVEATGGEPNVPVEDLPLKFTSFVFIRNIGAPATPSGGTYENPVPAGWNDGVPAGIDPIWMSTAVFTQGSTDPIVWTAPILTEDTQYTEYEYCDSTDPAIELDVDGKPLPPLEDLAQRTYWHDDATIDDNWMAIGNRVAGEYPTEWQVVKIGGEQGADGGVGPEGRSYTTSIVFTRTNLAGMETSIVSGGSFSSPLPTKTTIGGNPVAVTWSDGVPAGEEKVWMSKFVFNDVDHATASLSYIWTTPSATTDTSTDDFEFSSSVAQPADPDTAPSLWHDIATTNDIWMAHRSIANGVIGAWGITKIKGEAGEAGAGLDIQGRDTIPNILAMSSPPVELYDIWLANADEAGGAVPGVTNDAYLYVGAGNGDGGTAWDNIGSITGTDGTSYLQSFVFQRSATQPTTPTGGDFNSPVPAGWSDAPPAGTDPMWWTSRFFASDPTVNASLADWKAPAQSGDTIDLNFEYAGMQVGDATPLPPDQAAGGVWHNDPLTTDYWMAKAKKVNGVTDDTTWEVIRIKGEKGETGETGIPSFLSSAYIKTNDDISNINVTGGTYVSPLPTSQYDGVSWSDGIPAGTGAIWYVQVQFEQTDDGSSTKVWPKPALISDTTSIEYQFSESVSEPVAFPVEGNDGSNGWWDDASSVTTARWMAIGSMQNGVWPASWDVVAIIGEKGDTGDSARTYIPSTRFTRCDNVGIGQVTVSGQYLLESSGEYGITGANPTTDNTVGGYTYEFTDGIPAKEETFPNNASRVWMIEAVFNSVDHLGAANEMQWGNPQLLQDNSSIDYQYHAGDGSGGAGSKPSAPTGTGSNPDSTGWYDSPDLVEAADSNGAFWLAQRNWADGPSAQWVVYQIRGEDGTSSTEVVTETWYSSWHPWDPSNPDTTYTAGEISILMGTPDTDYNLPTGFPMPATNFKMWYQDKIPATIINQLDLDKTLLSSYYKIVKVDGVWGSPELITDRPQVDYTFTNVIYENVDFDEEPLNIRIISRLRFGDAIKILNTVAGAGNWDTGDILYLGMYPANKNSFGNWLT